MKTKTTRESTRETIAREGWQNMPYEVAIADHYEFDFGGESVARFKRKGDAYAYAKQLSESTGKATRVWNFKAKKEEFLIEPSKAA